MNKEFDFKNINKKTPYKIPEGFFDDITSQTLLKAKTRERKGKVRHIKFWAGFISSVSVAAILVVGMFSKLNDNSYTKTSIVDSLAVTMNESDSGKALEIDSSRSRTIKVKENTAVNNHGIDELLTSLSDEEINLLAEITMTDVFYNQQ